MKYEYSEPNKCIYLYRGYCTKDALSGETCSKVLCWNEDGSNNTPCDLEGYQRESYSIFVQLGESPMRQDPLVVSEMPTREEAQALCNRLNSRGTGYFYFMSTKELKKER